MDRDELAELLEQGLSINQIAAHRACAPSTVSYWLKRHRLRANGSARFAAKGGLDRVVLASLVAKGLSVPMIAERLSCSPALVGRSLARHRLKTALAPTDPGPGRHSNAVTEL